jgi:hypothetical protein
MASGEDFLMRPVLAGILPYIELNRNRLTLYDIALLNDALDVKNENERRLYEGFNNGIRS